MPKSHTTFKLGRYEVVGRIAVGGMATVYRARLGGAGGFAREFALKVVHPHLTQVEGFTERFLDEARVASRVRHPNCVATVDVASAHGYRFLVLELIDGLTLRQLELTRQKPLRPDEAARVIADAARGLHAVHEVEDDEGKHLDVIHRDLSPHNLMLDVRGRTILIDLGLAKAHGQLGHTQTGVLAGKLPYMSPEQSRLERLDARSDVFSLGTVLFNLVTSELPFGSDHTPGTLERLRKCDREDIARQLEEHRIPEWLGSVILACFHSEPGKRIPSALALAEALEQELHRHGRPDAEVRRDLALYAAEGKDSLGPDAPPDELKPHIEPVAEENAGLPVWVWAAAALVGAIAVGSYLSQRPDPAPVERNQQPARSLSTDAVPGQEAIKQPAQKKAPPAPAAPKTAPPAPVFEDTGETGDEPDLEGADRKRKARGRRPRLKQNPYQDP
jgi:serine/threonine-protein kinase